MSGVSLSRRTVLASGLALTALSGPIRPRAQGVEARADDIAWGVCGHPITAYPGVPVEAQLDLARSLGFTQYRINLASGGSPEHLETMIPLAASRGITLLPILHPEGELDDLSPQELEDRAHEVAREMSRRFRGDIPVWELSNELESYAILQPCEPRFDGSRYPCDWGPASGLGVLDYHPGRWPKVSAVLSGLSKGVKEGDPSARRAAGTAGWGRFGAYERMAADGVDWDITVWHDYEGLKENDLVQLARYGKPIWITEFNADAGANPPLTLEQQAEKVTARIASYRDLKTRFNIEAAHVYELLDEPYWGDTFEARMGLVALELDGEVWRIGDLKPSGLAVREALTGA